MIPSLGGYVHATAWAVNKCGDLKGHDSVHKKLAELSHLAMMIVRPILTGHTGTDGACRDSP